MARAKKIHYRCHWCGQSGWAFRSELLVQALTGRHFCSRQCLDSHLKSKGLA